MPNESVPGGTLVGLNEGPEVREAFDQLNRRLRDIAAQVRPEEARLAMNEIDELRESEGRID